ncbi:MAG: HAD hydrolase-like protein [Brevinematia bacterium]
MSFRNRILFLYDIDGTLVKLDGGRLVYQKVLSETLRKDISLEHIDWLGTTDVEVIHKILCDNGFAGKQLVTKMFEVFEKASELFREMIEKNPEKLRALPYAKETTEWTYKNYYNCLLTGNIRKIAYMKLSPFGMDKYFPVGAFGDEKKSRTKLVPIAIKRSMKHYNTSFDEFFIIGDSHRDTITARENGIRSIIVTTGKMSKEELEKFAPDFLIDSLSELPKIVAQFTDSPSPIPYTPDSPHKQH